MTFSEGMRLMQFCPRHCSWLSSRETKMAPRTSLQAALQGKYHVQANPEFLMMRNCLYKLELMMFEGMKVYFPITVPKVSEGLRVSLSREELEQIPQRYRWLLKLFLKLPNPSFPYFVLRRLPEIEGVFWAIIVPVFLILYFLFSVWFFGFASLHLTFPLNLLLGLLMPAIIFVFFVRIQLERTIHWWKNLSSTRQEWDISKIVEEFAELTRAQQRRRQTNQTRS